MRRKWLGLLCLTFLITLGLWGWLASPAHADDWQVGSIVGLCQGTEIREGPGLGYRVHTIVPENDWAVKIIDGPRYADGEEWWDTSRREAGDPSGGTGWVYRRQAESCRSPAPPPPSQGQATCGQWIEIDAGADRWPAFLPCGSNEPWVVDPFVGIDVSSLLGQYARVWDPVFGPDMGSVGGYPNVRYLVGISRYEPISDCGACGQSATATPPPPAPAQAVLISDLTIAPADPRPNQTVNARFTVRNVGGQTFAPRYFGVSGRGPGDASYDFLWMEGFTLEPGQEFTYDVNRQLGSAGDYWFTPNYSPDGSNWEDVKWADGRTSYVYLTVREVATDTPTPAPSPTPTQKPAATWTPAPTPTPSPAPPAPIQADVLCGQVIFDTQTSPMYTPMVPVFVSCEGNQRFLGGSGVVFPAIFTYYRLHNPVIRQLSPPRQFDGGEVAYEIIGWNSYEIVEGCHECEPGPSPATFTPLPPTETPVPPPTAMPPTSPPSPADVRLTSDLRLSPADPRTGQPVNARFQVRNYGGQPFAARYLGVKGRGPGGLDADLQWLDDFTLGPGETFTYDVNRSFDQAGDYQFVPQYSPDGRTWLDLTWPDGRTSQATLHVTGPATATPAPAPTAPPPPISGACSADAIRSYLRSKGSPLADAADAFVSAGQHYNVDPRFVVAIANAESTLGTNGRCATERHNAWGYGGGWPSCWSFGSWEEAIWQVTKDIGVNYFQRYGQTTIRSFVEQSAGDCTSHCWCASGCESWIGNVSDAYREMGGDPGRNDLSFAACSQTAVPTTMIPPSPASETIAIQAGHWKINELPPELAQMRNQTGTSGGGTTEMQVNVDIAQKVKEWLERRGYVVEVLPATVPKDYKARVFVSLHCDGNKDSTAHGYKLARWSSSSDPERDDRLVVALYEQYARATGMEQHHHITTDMTGYYAFSYLAPETAAAIIEMGFLTNPGDQDILIRQQDRAAIGIANGILAFLGEPAIQYQILHQTSATIAQGQASPLQTVNVSAGQEQLVVNLTWPGSALDLMLIDPQGRQVDFDYPGATWHVSQKVIDLVIENPMPGQWQTQVFGREVPEGQLEYQLSVAGLQELNPHGGGSGVSSSALPLVSLSLLLIGILIAGGLVLVWTQSRVMAPASAPYLQVTRGQAARPITPLPRRGLSLGRDPRSNLILADPGVSARHAQIIPTPSGYVLTDLGSKNGTWVNGQRVKQKPLRPGDVIRLGETELVFQLPGLGGPQPVSRRPAAGPVRGYLMAGRQRHPIPASGAEIGRGPRCAIVLADPQVSARHARLDWRGDTCVLTDLGSTNGTFVNGQRVSSQALRHGDEVRVGDTVFRFTP